MMEDKDVLLEAEGYTKRKRDEITMGRRKQQKEDDIRPEKCLHLSTASQSTQNPEGFYSEDWNEVQQEEDKWQVPDKWQRILQMVFCDRGLEINPVGDGAISSVRTQHQVGGCSVTAERNPDAEKAESQTQPKRLNRRRILAQD